MRLVAVGEEVAEVWRLVVGYVLPGDAHAVGVVVHEGGHAEIGGFGGGEDIQRGCIGGVPENDFLTPVAKDVGLQVGRGLRSVAGRRTAVVVGVLALDVETGGTVAVPLVDFCAVEELVLQVAVPVDAEVE